MTTSEEQPFPKRKRPVHGVHPTPDGPTIVFITACSKNRVSWMATPEVHVAMRAAWLSARAWLVGRYVIMPDHVHFFAAPGDMDTSIENWMGYWRRLVAQALGNSPGAWQDSQWDTRIRSANAYEEKWDYIRMNPVRKGLAQTPDTWAYAGELHPLPW